MEDLGMPAKSPRINVILDSPLYQGVRYLAERDGVSLSTKARDLIKEALEIQEDIYLAKLADKREKSLDKSNVLSHEKVWS